MNQSADRLTVDVHVSVTQSVTVDGGDQEVSVTVVPGREEVIVSVLVAVEYCVTGMPGSVSVDASQVLPQEEDDP